jgi:pyridoxal phosphate enzyme (YggS family)
VLQSELLYSLRPGAYNRPDDTLEERMETIREGYREVIRRIRQAAESAGRNAADVTLVAVSKTVPVEAIAALAPLAPVILGENRVQEAQAKQARLPGGGAFRWHLIGHLQSNKAIRAAELFEMIHSVDRLELLQRLERRCAELDKRLPVLIEVNLAAESSKTGCRPDEVPTLLDAACMLRHVRVAGFMAIPPFRENPDEVRPYFRQLRELRDRMSIRFGSGLELRELSMGMSHDFEAAIREGATLIRVGTAIFGARS